MPARASAAPVSRRVRARFDSAVTTDDNRRHWANADALSAGAAALPQVRRTLRMRSRYEVANNSYARGIVSTLANHCIGTGVRLQMRTPSPDANTRVEDAFSEWAQAIDLAGKLRTMRMAKTQDGEVFAIKTNNPALPTRVKLDIRLVEADQVTNPWPDAGALSSMSDGIEFDSHGNPTGYHLLRSHPGDLHALVAPKADLIPARNVIHYFRTERPGQLRGIPELTPALPLFAQLRRYTLAVLSAAESAADHAILMKTTAPPEGASQLQGEPFEAMELERGMMTVLPEGWDAQQMRAEQPTTMYPDFKRELLNEIGRCLEMPRNVVTGDSSSYNYASGRLDHQVYFRAIRVEQAVIERVVLDVILADFLAEAVLIEGLLPQSMRRLDAKAPHQWFWDGQEHVDPAKEANAQETRLKNHTTTLAEEYARRGRDWEVELRQRAKEAALMRELGLSTLDPAAVPPTEDGEEGAAATHAGNGRRPGRILERLYGG